ncbi:MAG: DUF2461 domain-containing protein [Tannerellaceae bacterium]|jgi:uncharacterized protein (TIGR02453 family)|nr:DUF2461 domain-containing protein [Tannerellaceae bacterium]
MIQDIITYLQELAVNNNREWFQSNKGRYDRHKQEFLEIVQDQINRISVVDRDLEGLRAEDCVFRIYNDLRFSHSKLPYKQHFGAYMAAGGGRKSFRSGYYLHLEPGNCMLSGGLWRPEPKLRKRVRDDIFHHTDEFVAILEAPEFKAVYPRIDGDMITRVPTGYPADYEYAHLLRYQEYCISYYLPDGYFDNPDWANDMAQRFILQLPFHRFLNTTVDLWMEDV